MKACTAFLVLSLLTGGTALAQKTEKQKPTSRPSSRPAKAAWEKDRTGRFQKFGAGLTKRAPKSVGVGELTKNLDEFVGKTVRVTGTVEKTCPKKGCWMWVTEGKGRVFVRFKDYGFFVPKKDAEGRTVVFEGKVSHKKLSVKEARHYAEDAGDFEGAKKITKPQMIPFVLSTGVKMYDKPKKTSPKAGEKPATRPARKAPGKKKTG